MIWNNENGWSWRRHDVITELFDDFGVFNHIDKTFIPRRYTKDEEKITSDDRLFDQHHFEKRGIQLGNTNYLYEYYGRKNCFYIQIENRGFYYLQKDIANIEVPQFNPDLTLRLRAKTHHSYPIYKYSFFAVIQLGSRPVNSIYDLEEKVGNFPPI